MGSYGIKTSIATNDAHTTDLSKLLVHSEYALLKIAASGTGTASLTDTGAGFSGNVYTHGLGYTPRFLLFSDYYDSFLNTEVTTFRKMPHHDRSAGGVIWLSYTPAIDSTELTYAGATAGGDSSSHTINFYWFVFYDPE